MVIKFIIWARRVKCQRTKFLRSFLQSRVFCGFAFYQHNKSMMTMALSMCVLGKFRLSPMKISFKIQFLYNSRVSSLDMLAAFSVMEILELGENLFLHNVYPAAKQRDKHLLCIYCYIYLLYSLFSPKALQILST